MPQATVRLRLENTVSQPIIAIEVAGLVDTDVHHLYLPPAIVARLGLSSSGDTRTITAVDGLSVRERYVGPLSITVNNAQAHTGAVEHGDQIIVGNIPLAASALKFDPITSELVDDLHALRI